VAVRAIRGADPDGRAELAASQAAMEVPPIEGHRVGSTDTGVALEAIGEDWLGRRHAAAEHK
jgi:hypothetical protein